MKKDPDTEARALAETEAWLDSLDPDRTPPEDISDLRAVAAAVNDVAVAERRVRETVGPLG